MQSMCYGKQKTKFCKIYATPTMICTPKEQHLVMKIFQIVALGPEQKESMKMLHFNSSGVQGPQLKEQKALKLCHIKL
jgi:hypothetical protein